MLPSIDIVPDRRRKLGLTQSQLASLAGVSQSYIAKLEAGKIEPSYLKVKAIFESLDRLERKKEVSAAEIMVTDVISVQASATIQDAVDMMRRHGFSQLPVVDGDKPVGGLSERTLLDQILYPEDDRPPTRKIVRDIMDESFPQVAEDAPLSLLSNLLKYYPAVLVQRKGEIAGIVTKADLLGTIS
ncbi:MAG: CBS domain-containing protein [Candidatus Bathyarchaeota archaeon]|nr:CBS domain-containing protein [Candidatus Bathyarchaeota archaeon]